MITCQQSHSILRAVLTQAFYSGLVNKESIYSVYKRAAGFGKFEPVSDSVFCLPLMGTKQESIALLRKEIGSLLSVLGVPESLYTHSGLIEPSKDGIHIIEQPVELDDAEMIQSIDANLTNGSPTRVLFLFSENPDPLRQKASASFMFISNHGGVSL